MEIRWVHADTQPIIICMGLVGITRLHMHIHSPPCFSFPSACRFGDGKGLNYLQFLEQLQPPEKLEDKYQTRMTQLSTTQAGVYTTAKSILVYLSKLYSCHHPLNLCLLPLLGEL